MDNKYSRSHDEGYIHIHDLDFWAMGTTTCMQIDLNKLFKNMLTHKYMCVNMDIRNERKLVRDEKLNNEQQQQLRDKQEKQSNDHLQKNE